MANNKGNEEIRYGNMEPFALDSPKYRATLVQLAAMGRRWFAKPPAGFEPPCLAAAASTTAFAAHLTGASKLNVSLGIKIASNDAEEMMVVDTYAHIHQKWLKENGPTFFVDPELLKMCEQTDVLGNVKGSDIKTVYPVVYVSLPMACGFHSKQTGGTSRHIWMRIIEEGEKLPYWDCGKEIAHKSIPDNKRKIMIMGYWDNSIDVNSFLIDLSEPDKSLLEVINESKAKFQLGFLDRPNSEEELLDEAIDIGSWFGSLAVNLCLIMQSYPQYVVPTEKKNSERQSFRDREAPASYIVKLDRSTSRPIRQTTLDVERTESEPSGRASPRLHWRRGIWRRQPHGDQWELAHPKAKFIVLPDGRHAHMKWLRPILCGGVK